jgi:hypothetical protein
MDDAAAGALLAVMRSYTSAVEGMPAVLLNYDLKWTQCPLERKP